jgi:hypothetical protein
MLDVCTIPTFKQSSLRIMVWGCVMYGRKGPLIVLEYPGGRGGGMNSKCYQDQVLQGMLKRFYNKEKRRVPSLLFQQDSAPSHTSKSTLKWFKTNRIKLFEHPAASPDVSVVEPCWGHMKRHIRARPHPPTSLDELKQAAYEAWDALDVATINHYVDRMPKVIHTVIKARGGNTPF